MDKTMGKNRTVLARRSNYKKSSIGRYWIAGIIILYISKCNMSMYRSFINEKSNKNTKFPYTVSMYKGERS
jgi:hypothetical protein